MEKHVRAQVASNNKVAVRIYLPMKVDVKIRARFLRDLRMIRFRMMSHRATPTLLLFSMCTPTTSSPMMRTASLIWRVASLPRSKWIAWQRNLSAPAINCRGEWPVRKCVCVCVCGNLHDIHKAWGDHYATLAADETGHSRDLDFWTFMDPPTTGAATLGALDAAFTRGTTGGAQENEDKQCAWGRRDSGRTVESRPHSRR